MNETEGEAGFPTSIEADQGGGAGRRWIRNLEEVAPEFALVRGAYHDALAGLEWCIVHAASPRKSG